MSYRSILKTLFLAVGMSGSLAHASELACITDKAEIPRFVRDRVEIVTASVAFPGVR